MSKRIADNDATIVIRHKPTAPSPVKRRSILKQALAGAALVGVPAALGAGWLTLRRPADPPFPTTTEAQIDAAEPCAIEVSHFALSPAVTVIDFPDLTTQGMTLDRVAAFVEKAGVPHDRVLDDAGLAAAIAADGDTVANYYYGHDYQAADLARFFALASQEGIALNQYELWLQKLLVQLDWLRPGAVGAIITVPAEGGILTADMRPVILHHEISHGAFYTVPAYRAYAESFWYSLNDEQRAGFTGFLGREGYNTANTELMLNETQAYLIFTRDPRFFAGSAVGMSEDQINALRAGFIANMPDFWLTPLANAALPLGNPVRQCATTAFNAARPCPCARLGAARRFMAEAV